MWKYDLNQKSASKSSTLVYYSLTQTFKTVLIYLHHRDVHDRDVCIQSHQTPKSLSGYLRDINWGSLLLLLLETWMYITYRSIRMPSFYSPYFFCCLFYSFRSYINSPEPRRCVLLLCIARVFLLFSVVVASCFKKTARASLNSEEREEKNLSYTWKGEQSEFVYSHCAFSRHTVSVGDQIWG